MKDESLKVAKKWNEETKQFENNFFGEVNKFCALRSKLYGIVYENDQNQEIKCKGINKTCVKNNIKFDTIKNCLFSEEKKYFEMKRIRSIDHNIYLQNIKKCGLSSDDDKRDILPNKISTYALGHFRIPK